MTDRETPRPLEPAPDVPAPPSRLATVRVVLLAAAVLYAVLFVVLNTGQVEVNFVFFSARSSLVVGFVVSLLIGFLAGYLFELRALRQQLKGRRR